MGFSGQAETPHWSRSGWYLRIARPTMSMAKEDFKSDLSSSLKSSFKSESAKDIEVSVTNNQFKRPNTNATDADMPRKETHVRYKRNSTTGSKGSIQEEIRIYDNPYTSYYPVDGRENESLRCFTERRAVSFYLRDAFCPMRRACTTAICCILAMLFISLLLSTPQFHTTKSKSQMQISDSIFIIFKNPNSRVQVF